MKIAVMVVWGVAILGALDDWRQRPLSPCLSLTQVVQTLRPLELVVFKPKLFLLSLKVVRDDGSVSRGCGDEFVVCY